MPVPGMGMSECPAEILKTDAACYAFVLIDVFLIIVVNELMPARLTKNNPRNYDKTNAQRAANQRELRLCLSSC